MAGGPTRDELARAAKFARELADLLDLALTGAAGDPSAEPIARALDAVQKARAHYQRRDAKDLSTRRVRRAKRQLDIACKTSHLSPPTVREREEAARRTAKAIVQQEIKREMGDALVGPSVKEWTAAILAWPSSGQAKPRRGRRTKGSPDPWHVIVFRLLKPHGLIGASTARNMLDGYKSTTR